MNKYNTKNQTKMIKMLSLALIVGIATVKNTDILLKEFSQIIDKPKPPSMHNVDPKKYPDTNMCNKDSIHNKLDECIKNDTTDALNAMICLWKDIEAAFGSIKNSTVHKDLLYHDFSKFDMTQPVMYFPKLPFMTRHNYQNTHWSANFSFEEGD
tara:strand:+ start:191 stop:652 length:462 start_codon:yes stop_codon:yes gene_type:complete